MFMYIKKNSLQVVILQGVTQHISYSKRDLNPHSRNGQGILSPSCLPIPPFEHPFGAENETRTRDPNLGKVVLYQLSYFRKLCPKKDGCKDKQFPLDGQTFQTHFFYHD